MVKARILELLNIVAPLLPAPIYWEDINSVLLGGNEAVFKATGAGHAAAYVGKTLFELYPNDMAEHIKKHNEEVMRTGDVLAQEEMIKDITTGEIKYFTAIKAPLRDDDGNIIGIVGTSIDITEEKKLVAALHIAKEKAEEANTIKTAFIANMSQDIRTSLTGVIGLSDVLEKSSNNPKQKEEARILSHSGEELISMLDDILNDMQTENAQEHKKYERIFNLQHLAKQIAHDIRSPILALETICQLSPELPAEKRELIKNTTKRINTIVSNLFEITNIKQLSNSVPTTKGAFIVSLINQIIEEKKIEYFSKMVIFKQTISEDAYNIIADISKEQLERCFSNILNNSIEAVERNGIVEIYVNIINNQIHVTISDNGKGIPKDKIGTVFVKGFSHDKKNGYGLGLSFAKECIEQSGGSISIESEIGKGSLVYLIINISPMPSWMCVTIDCSNYQSICILDDDKYIHQIWRKKFSALFDDRNILSFFNVDSFLKFVNESTNKNILYMVDYEISGCTQNGLQLISQLNIQSDTILVSGHYYDDKVTNGCTFSKVKLLPKDILNDVTIFKSN